MHRSLILQDTGKNWILRYLKSAYLVLGQVVRRGALGPEPLQTRDGDLDQVLDEFALVKRVHPRVTAIAPVHILLITCDHVSTFARDSIHSSALARV